MTDRKPTHIIVKSHHPVLKRALLVLLTVAIATGGWLLFEYGRQRAGFDVVEASRMQGALKERIEALETENRRLNSQIVILERAGEIDRRAHDEVNRDLANLQDELLELRQEVEFYRGILNAEASDVSGLKIQTLRLRQDSEPRRYHYRLILSQLATTNPRIKGKAEMSVSGVIDGGQIELSHRDLVGNEGGPLQFDLRHFQELTGSITLPEGFVPVRLMLKVIPGSRNGVPLERSFTWSELVS